MRALLTQLTNNLRRHLLGAILVVGFVARLSLAIYVAPYPERYITADAIVYNQLAINLLAGHGFSQLVEDPYVPDNFRTPLYPLTIAMCYAIVGYSPGVVLLLQVLMGTLTILVVYCIGKLISGRRAGLLSAAIIAVSPVNVIYSAQLWSDTEFTLFFTLCVLLTILMISRDELRWVLLSSITAGIATLIHPRILFLPVLFAILLLIIRLRKHAGARTAFAHAGMYVILFVLMLLPWVVRNYRVFGVPNLTSAAAFNLLDYGAALTEATQTGENQWVIMERYHEEILAANPRAKNEARFAEDAVPFALKKIAQSPLAFAKVQLIGMAKIFLPGTLTFRTLLIGQPMDLDSGDVYSLLISAPSHAIDLFIDVMSEFPTVVLLYIALGSAYLLGVYVFAAVSLISKHRSRLWSVLFAVILLYLAAVAGPAGAPRFRVAMMPLISMLAAQGIVLFVLVIMRMRVRSSHSRTVSQ